MPLKLYNTLTRKKEIFKPIRKDEVTFYSCGPTVYDYAHIGNLRTYLFADILKRVLLYDGYNVKHVMNLTDVGHLTSDADTGEDKMEKGAKRERKTAWQIADFYTQEFKNDIKQLNILPPTLFTRATDNISEQIELIKVLESKEYTYIIEGDGVYFDTGKLKDYGKLARLDIKGLEAGARVELAKGKKNKTDFALWKFSNPPQAPLYQGGKRDMEWESPWGKGFPGWHIECSAMSLKYLANGFHDGKLSPEDTKTIDIHTGGIDHIPVHHTNEIAQSEAATGKKFVNLWMHGEFLNVTLKNNTHYCPFCSFPNLIKDKSGYIQKNEPDGVLLLVKCQKCKKLFSGSIKMAKSAGTFITLNNLIAKGYNPLAYRYFVMGAHYRTSQNFTWEGLTAAENAFSRLKSQVASWEMPLFFKSYDKKFADKFQAHINNDLDMPGALALVWELVKSKLKPEIKKATMLKFDQVLGLRLNEARKEEVKIGAELKKLVDEREEARKTKDWDRADKLRQEIGELGYEIEDTSEGARVVKKK